MLPALIELPASKVFVIAPGAMANVTFPVPPPINAAPALIFVTTPSTKYPLMSMTTCVVCAANTLIEALDPAGTIAAVVNV